MPKNESLRRLGGGRWQSKDGRFTVEPESGTWVVVDNTQTNELGLPLVRGPYPSLTAAREAIEDARDSGPSESPLAERIRATPKPKAEPAKKKPEPPAEPKWLRDLDESEHRKAKALIKRLDEAGVGNPEAVARAETADELPAVARVALERGFTEAAAAKDAATAVRLVVDVLLKGRDERTGARWSIVDGEGRRLTKLDVPD
jgi:hypothetical protein